MKENPEMQLVDHILITSEITCDFCGVKEIIDDPEAEYNFYQEGWRGRAKCYCPKCAKKKLKKNQ